MKNLPTMFLYELGEILDFENQSSRNFAKLQQASACRSLSRVMSVQKTGTTTSAKRIESVFEAFNRAAKPIASNALDEMTDLPRPFGGSQLSANCLFSILLRIEHYRMATYVCLRDWAALLGNEIATMHLHDGFLDARALHASLARIGRLEGLGGSISISQREILPHLEASSDRELLRWLVEAMTFRSTQWKPASMAARFSAVPEPLAPATALVHSESTNSCEMAHAAVFP